MSGLDDRIHHPTRLQLCAMLAVVEDVEFGFARDRLGVTDSVLSKHAKVLEDAGYLIVRKGVSSGRRRTWFSLTMSGRSAFRAHISELQRLVGSVTSPSPSSL